MPGQQTGLPIGRILPKQFQQLYVLGKLRPSGTIHAWIASSGFYQLPTLPARIQAGSKMVRGERTAKNRTPSLEDHVNAREESPEGTAGTHKFLKRPETDHERS